LGAAEEGKTPPRARRGRKKGVLSDERGEGCPRVRNYGKKTQMRRDKRIRKANSGSKVQRTLGKK